MQEIVDDLDSGILKRLIQSTTSSISCTICQEIMFTPFVLNCGHSFCYSCLKEWFRNRRQCPLCRNNVRRPPIMNITFRELVAGVISTLNSDAVNKSRISSLQEYETDLKEGNLFHRIFHDLIETTHDGSDGVPRCSRCLWEVHGSSCLNCGATLIDNNEHESDEEEDLYFSGPDMDDGDEEDEGEDIDDSSDGSSFLDDRDLDLLNEDLEDVYSDILDDSNMEENVSYSNWGGFSDDNESAPTDSEIEFEEAVRRVNGEEDDDHHPHEFSSDESDCSGDVLFLNNSHQRTGRSRAGRIIDSDDE